MKDMVNRIPHTHTHTLICLLQLLFVVFEAFFFVRVWLNNYTCWLSNLKEKISQKKILSSTSNGIFFFFNFTVVKY